MKEQMKTTTPISSVGADEGQSSNQITGISIADNSGFFNPQTEISTSTQMVQGQNGSSCTLPQVIRDNCMFCCWRYEERNGARTKVPYDPRTGSRARSNDVTSFCGYEQAAQAQGYDGLGIGMFYGICAIDLDDCIEDGRFTETAQTIIDLMHSYTEYSPSGKGVHILFAAPDFQYNSDAYYIMNHAAGIEVYVAGATSKYVTITGHQVNAYQFAVSPPGLQTVLDRFMRKPTEKVASKNHAVNAINAVNSPDEQEILRLAASGKNGSAFTALWKGDCTGYPSHSEADMALCGHLAFWAGRDAVKMDAMFRKSGLMRDKWDRKQSGSTYGSITVQNAIAHCTEVYTPPHKPKSEAGKADTKKDTVALFQPFVPLKPQSSDLPAFPVACLPPVLRDYVSAVAEHSQTSPDMASVIGLGVLAVCLQGKYQVQGTLGYLEPLSLYTMVIAAPGERKSSVMRDMTSCIYDYEAEYNEARKPEIRRNRMEREALERQITRLEKELERKYVSMMELELQHTQDQLNDLPEIKPVRFFADDCSSEALTSLLAANGGRFAVISTEGGIFDIMAGRYSSKMNIDVWLKGHCGDNIRIDRLGREAEYIPHPALSALLSIQPSVLGEIMANTTMNGRGLIARFLYASPPSRIGSRVFQAPPIPPEVSAAYRSLVYQLLALPVQAEPIALTLSTGGRALIDSYFQRNEQFLKGEGQDISDWASKYIGSILRIAGLLHVAQAAEEQHEISATTMQNAIDIGTFFLSHARYAYAMMSADLDIQKASLVLAKLRKRDIKEIKRQELFQMCRGKFFRRTEDILPTIDLLEEHGYLRQEQPPYMGIGRPPDVRIILNPDAKEA